MADAAAVPVGPGTFVIEVAGTRRVVYVARQGEDIWAFWNGHVFRSGAGASHGTEPRAHVELAQQLTSPMPATVVQVLVSPGARVKKGEAVVLLEAMKMELPVRARAEGTVSAVRCRAGELVQAEQVLVEINA
jgi:biotin carboxyl carrier protein